MCTRSCVLCSGGKKKNKERERERERESDKFVELEFNPISPIPGLDEDEADEVCGKADSHLQSWIYWALKSYQDITTQVCVSRFSE